MCFITSTEDKGETHECPMCKVFKSTRCRHVSDICRNQENHPSQDVMYLKNAEVPIFNGCGYCKWVRANPTLPPDQNPGWPGCCRPPDPQETRLVQASEWPAVSLVHQVPVPPNIKAILDSASAGKIGPTPTTAAKPSTAAPAITIPATRRSDSSGTPTKSSPPTAKSSPSAQSNKALPPTPSNTKSGSAATPKKRSGSGSPRTTALSPSSLSNTQGLDGQRRQGSSDAIDKLRVSPPRRSSELPRRSSEMETPTSRRGSAARAPIVTTSPTIPSPSSTIRRRSSISSSQSPKGVSPSPGRASERPYATISGRTNGRRPSIDAAINGKGHNAPSSVASSKSSGSGSETSAMTDSTVTSDGGFTDYLSDESDAELQRQAEARAVLAAQNQAEEAEFKAARQQLAHIGLRPPKAWNPNNEAGRMVPVPAMAQAGGGQRA